MLSVKRFDVLHHYLSIHIHIVRSLSRSNSGDTPRIRITWCAVANRQRQLFQVITIEIDMTNEECMRAARSVTLFIHGVGTQTPSEMAGLAEKGFWRARNRRDDRTQLLTMELGPAQPAAPAFAIRTSGESHVVV